VIPTRQTWFALWAWLALGLAAAFVADGWVLWAVWGSALGLALAVEALLLLREAPPELERTLPATLSLGTWHPVTARLRTPGTRILKVLFHGDLPPHHEGQGVCQPVSVPADGWVELAWRIRATRRGPVTFDRPWIAVTGRGGFLTRRMRVGTAAQVKVYPDFRRVAHYGLLSLQDRTAWLGLHRQRRRGDGLEFHQLREYRPGDSLRQIDWKAVSRRRELVSREYQEERNQQLIVLLDCGRRMRAIDGELSHFDHALNAVLLLSYVGLRYGDAVGLMTFSGEDRWLPPIKGGHAMNTLLNLVYDLQSTTMPTDYVEGARRLAARQRRRALVVVVSNLGDADGGELPQAMQLLARRHLVVHASLRETALDRVLEDPVQDLAGALRISSTHALLEGRAAAHDALRRRGVKALDVAPSELPAALVDRYLAIKRAGVL
jgi:uncharacterized protein (DUF58 family)